MKSIVTSSSARPDRWGLVPLGFILGLGAVLAFHHFDPQGVGLHPADYEPVRFILASFASQPLLCFGALGFFAAYFLISAEARRRGASTTRLLAVFKSTGFSVSLALVAMKLPGILERNFEAAAAIAPVYHTIAWITAAVAGMCLLECLRETRRILQTRPAES